VTIRYTTGRLLARDLDHSDIPELQRIAGRNDVARMLFSAKSPWPRDEVQDWIDNSYWTGKAGFRLGLCLKDDPYHVVGAIGLGGDPVSCAFFIDPVHWNKGYATEAMKGLLSVASNELGLSEVEADHFHDNPASRRVLIKLGFCEIGTGLGTSAAREEAEPVVIYAKEI